MVKIECELLSSIKGSDRWVEGVIYSAYLGARLGLGGCVPSKANSVVRLETSDHSSYEYQGGAVSSGGRTGISTIYLEEKLLIEPSAMLERTARLSTICAVTAHEAVHHRAIVEIDEFLDDGYGGELDAEYDAERRKIILELLGVHDLILESRVTPSNLDRYWSANTETWLEFHPEQDLQEAALNARNEFLGQVAACLARQHLRNGPDEVRSLVTSRSGNAKSSLDRVIPLPYVFLLEKLIESTSSTSAEPEAREGVSTILGRNPRLPDAVLFRLRP